MEEIIPPREPGNLQDYENALKEFNWASMDKEFDWSRGGPYNVAAEAMDRHLQTWRKNKIALFSVRASGEVRKFTFGEMSELSSRFASGLVKLGAKQGRPHLRLPGPQLRAVHLRPRHRQDGRDRRTAVLRAGPGGGQGPRPGLQLPSIIITSPYLYKRIEPIMDDLVDVEKYIIVGDNAELEGDTVNFDEVLASGDPGLPGGRHGADRPVHHPLHLRLHRQAQGRAAGPQGHGPAADGLPQRGRP